MTWTCCSLQLHNPFSFAPWLIPLIRTASSHIPHTNDGSETDRILHLPFESEDNPSNSSNFTLTVPQNAKQTCASRRHSASRRPSSLPTAGLPDVHRQAL